MTRFTGSLAFALVTTAFVAAAYAQSSSPAPATAAAYFVESSMNVFRRFNGDGARTLAFYGQVLGFGDIGAVGGVSRYQVGPSQLKFTRAGANAKFTRGGIHDAAGVRLWTMWFPDEETLTRRFAAHGFPSPVFKTVDLEERREGVPGDREERREGVPGDREERREGVPGDREERREGVPGGSVRSALVADPDGEWVHLVIAPNAPKEVYGRLEIGIAANDLEKSRAFYRTFVGLEELPAVKDPVLGVTKYPFRHGTTTVSVWATPGPKPVNQQLAGIQYVVKPVDPIWALAQERAIPVEQPLGETLPGLVTTWLYDPDRVTNYFAEIRPRQRTAQTPTR